MEKLLSITPRAFWKSQWGFKPLLNPGGVFTSETAERRFQNQNVRYTAVLEVKRPKKVTAIYLTGYKSFYPLASGIRAGYRFFVFRPKWGPEVKLQKPRCGHSHMKCVKVHAGAHSGTHTQVPVPPSSSDIAAISSQKSALLVEANLQYRHCVAACGVILEPREFFWGGRSTSMPLPVPCTRIAQRSPMPHFSHRD
jgi:hypothetical protein